MKSMNDIANFAALSWIAHHCTRVLLSLSQSDLNIGHYWAWASSNTKTTIVGVQAVWARIVSLPASQAAMAMLNDLQDAYRSEEFQRLFASWVSGHAHLRSSAVGTFSAIYKKKIPYQTKNILGLKRLVVCCYSCYGFCLHKKNHKQVSPWAEWALARFIQEICWEDGQKLKYLRLWPMQRTFQHSNAFCWTQDDMDKTCCDMPIPEKNNY